MTSLGRVRGYAASLAMLVPAACDPPPDSNDIAPVRSLEAGPERELAGPTGAEFVASEGRFTIEGQVVASEDQSPIAGATVTIWRLNRSRFCGNSSWKVVSVLRSGTDGSFRLVDGDEPYTARIAVEAIGWVPTRRCSPAANLDPWRENDELDFTGTIELERGGEVHGLLRSIDGDPISSWRVEVKWLDLPPLAASVGNFATTADSQGRFTLNGFPFDVPFLVVASDLIRPRGWSVPDSIPSAGRRSVRCVIDIPWSTTLDGVVLRSEQFEWTWASLEPLEAAVAPYDGTVSCDESGRFRFEGVPEGRYELTVGEVGGAGLKPMEITVRRNERLPNLEVVLAQGSTCSIAGRVHGFENAFNEGEVPRLQLLATDDVAEVQRDGSFKFEGLARKDYEIALAEFESEGWWIDPVVVAGGTEGIELTAWPSHGRFCGRLVGEPDVERLRGNVVLIHAKSDQWFFPEIAPDGSFDARNMPPGTYDLHFDDRDRGFGKVPLNGSIELGRDEVVDLGDIEIPGIQTHRGRVIEFDGSPSANAELLFFPRGVDFGFAQGTTAEDGTFEIVTHFVPGFVAVVPERGPALYESVDRPGTDLTFRLGAGSALIGRVLGPLGEGLAGATLVVRDWPDDWTREAARARTDASGWFQLRGVPEGEWRIEVLGPGETVLLRLESEDAQFEQGRLPDLIVR